MAAGVLYTYPENFRAYKVLIAAKFSGANITVDPNFVFGETNKSEQFLKKFPYGKVPAFESADGKVCLTESNAIAYYVANEALRGSDPLTQARVWQWAFWADCELLPPACAWVFPYIGIMTINNSEMQRAKNDLLTALRKLDKILLTRTYLVSERITLADINVFANLIHPFQIVLEPKLRAELKNVERWFQTIANHPDVKVVVGEIKVCDAPPKLPAHPKENDVKKEKNKPAQKKEQAPKKETAPAANADSKEEEEAPKDTSSFNMDEFKRCYSNEDESVSIPFFWQKFDPENYSIWYAEYKYPEELAKVFMSCNLITGMFQRLDKMRKVAFSSVCLFGKDNDSSISGVWVWRGQDLIFTQSPDWQIDYESYDWKKLDPSSEETKKLVNNYFSWTGTDKKNRPFNQGKVFK